MNNKEIARKFNLLAKLMELNGENSFKIRSYSSAYNSLRKFPDPLSEMSEEEIGALPGIGKAIQAKIIELVTHGEMAMLQEYLDLTPPGIVEMLMIKGLGPKKVDKLWKELEIESPGELLYACNENRLVDLKGFGQKTQASIKEQIEYHLSSRDKFHFATLELPANNLVEELQDQFPNALVELTGEMARRCQIVNSIEILSTIDPDAFEQYKNEEEEYEYQGYPVFFIEAEEESFWQVLLETSSDDKYLDHFELEGIDGDSEEDIYEKLELDFHPAFLREKENIDWLSRQPFDESLIVTDDDIKGVVHNHSTYSDGVNTLADMAKQTEKLGYEYLVMTDHSQSAFYANGLKEDRLLDQLEEIAELNKVSEIRIFSGIESDILFNGDLDYPDEILAKLDVIVASVHSVLKMDEAKATSRLITAIENPYTRILGHPTGRLLLSRKGYPVNFDKVIDACAANNVVIEMNANPYRLDMDWRFINKAMDKGVMISINPDAHSIAGIEDIHYGVYAASKGGLTAEMCLNTKDLKGFEAWVAEK